MLHRMSGFRHSWWIAGLQTESAHTSKLTSTNTHKCFGISCIFTLHLCYVYYTMLHPNRTWCLTPSKRLNVLGWITQQKPQETKSLPWSPLKPFPFGRPTCRMLDENRTWQRFRNFFPHRISRGKDLPPQFLEVGTFRFFSLFHSIFWKGIFSVGRFFWSFHLQKLGPKVQLTGRCRSGDLKVVDEVQGCKLHQTWNMYVSTLAHPESIGIPSATGNRVEGASVQAFQPQTSEDPQHCCEW